MSRIREYIRSISNLSDFIDVEAAGDSIRSNIHFSGPNVYILACAVIIASVGLNVNSIPVIIGAMLISPLMGPIMGFGLGLGTNDTEVLRSALRNFMAMVMVSIVASTLYFLITPLKLDEPVELLARTKPTIYDVLIALFGGFAGTLETCRREKGTVLSGVAIATALMPPLCTVGYGISELNIHYITGALYLFTINSIFISLAVFVSTKYFGFHVHEFNDPHAERRRKWRIGILVALIMVPSLWTAFCIIRENNFSIHAQSVIRNHKTIGASYVYDWHINTDSRPYSVEIFIAGDHLTEDQKEIFYTDAQAKGISREQLIFREEAAQAKTSENEIVRGIYEYYDRRIQELNETITQLEVELAARRDNAGGASEAPKDLSEDSLSPGN